MLNESLQSNRSSKVAARSHLSKAARAAIGVTREEFKNEANQSKASQECTCRYEVTEASSAAVFDKGRQINQYMDVIGSVSKNLAPTKKSNLIGR